MLDDVRKPESERREWIVEVLKDIDGKHTGFLHKGELVRCKECKYEPICSHSVQHTTHKPTSVTIGYKSVDFCSYGEREEDE